MPSHQQRGLFYAMTEAVMNFYFPIYLSDGRLIKKETDLKPEERRYKAGSKKT